MAVGGVIRQFTRQENGKTLNCEERVTPDGLRYEICAEGDIQTTVREFFLSLARKQYGAESKGTVRRKEVKDGHGTDDNRQYGTDPYDFSI